MLKELRDNGHLDGKGDYLIDVDSLLAIARRQWKTVAISVAAFVLAGSIYMLTAVPLYTATARLLIDINNQKIVNELSAIGGMTGDDASILSQVELLQSKKIAESVVDTKGLIDNQAFQADGTTLVASLSSAIRGILDVSSWFREPKEAPDVERQKRSATAKVLSGLRVERVARTYVLEISYTSASPQLAANMTQAIAEAYLVDQLDSKFEATRRASTWLQERIEELRQQSLETDLAVQKFKAEKGLITTGGELITDQQLSQINSKLIAARAETAEAEAKYARIRNIIDTGQMDAAVNESLNSSVINRLRESFLDASRRAADISSRLGEKHEQVIKLRTEMQEYRRLIFEELSRIAQSYQSSLEVARESQSSLEQQVAQATGVAVTANDAQVQLRELEREAETYRNLYQTFLLRYQEAIQQESFPVNEARIISRADIPGSPSFPRRSIVLAACIFLGIAAGSAAGAFREFRDRFFRTGEQVRQELDAEFLGNVPLKEKRFVDQPRSAQEAAGRREIVHTSNLTNYVTEHPLSPFAETLRSAQLAADLVAGKKIPKVIGILSSIPGEGKSTIAVNFAELLASQGKRTLLIDADLRTPGATRAIAAHAEKGLLEGVLDRVPLSELVLNDPQSTLAFLPTVTKRRVPYSSELLSSEGMEEVIAQAMCAYEYVVIDLPPLGPVVDAKVLADVVDTFIYVVEWGKTARQVVKTTLNTNPRMAAKCAGVILNKVDTSKMQLYQVYGSHDYYYSKYKKYYNQDSQ